MEEAICWAFEIVPSEWDDKKWKVTLQDVRIKIELKAGIESVHGSQMYQAIAEVAADIFADPKKRRSTTGTIDDVPKTKEQAMKMFADIFGAPKNG